MTTLIHPPRVQDAIKKLNRDLFFDRLHHARRIKEVGYDKQQRYCFYFGFFWGQQFACLEVPRVHHAVAEAEMKGEYK